MSAGDIDDRLGPEGKLDELRRRYPLLHNYLNNADSLPILRACIPYIGGISQDGKTRYIDSRLDCILDGIDISQAIATHESVEWALREYAGIGIEYDTDPTGHRLANRAELDKVIEIFHDSAMSNEELWDRYDAFIDPQISAIEHGEITNVPSDLALYPYIGTELFEKLQEVMK